MGLFSVKAAAGFEVGQRMLRAVVLKKGGTRPGIAWASQVELPAGLLLNSFTEPNITDVPSFVSLAGRLVQQAGRRVSRINVALPDHVSRVSILEFDSLQGKKDEVEQMLRWRLKKLLPFDVEQAAMRYQYLGEFQSNDKDQHRFLVSIIKSDILSQYELAFREAGLKPLAIDLSSFCVWNLYEDFIAKDSGGLNCFAVMMLAGGKLTVMVFERGVPHFFRLKDMGGFDGEENGMAVTRILRELNASLTFYRENYGDSPVEKVYMTADDPDRIKLISEEVGKNSILKTTVLDLGLVLDRWGAKEHSSPAFGAACGAALEG